MNYAEIVDEGLKYDDAQTLAIRDGLNTKVRVNQIPYTRFELRSAWARKIISMYIDLTPPKA